MHFCIIGSGSAMAIYRKSATNEQGGWINIRQKCPSLYGHHSVHARRGADLER